MPPRKRTKTTHAVSATPPSQAKTPTPAEENEDNADDHLLNDPWTDEEEIGLFKGMIKYKPTGIHKHFRLLALHQFMLDNGYIHPKAEHTKPAGIWRKLESLYQLDSLDEREDARQLERVDVPKAYQGSREGSEDDEEEEDDAEDDVYSEAANRIDNDEFYLAGEEFAAMKWARRLPERQVRGESPPVLPDVNLADEAPVRFTPSFSIEPSENATPTARRGRGRGRAGTVGERQKGAAAAAAPAAGASTRRSARKAGSVADDAEKEEEEEEGGQDEEGEQEDEDEEEESEENESQESTPALRSTRNTKGARGRGGGSTKTPGRGRPRRK